MLELATEKFMLQGVIIFEPPLAAIQHHFTDIGHYKCCVKIDNSSWEVFDDMEKNAKMMKKNKEVVIHSLFYVRINNK